MSNVIYELDMFGYKHQYQIKKHATVHSVYLALLFGNSVLSGWLLSAASIFLIRLVLVFPDRFG
jgi:hypothetical protein